MAAATVRRQLARLLVRATALAAVVMGATLPVLAQQPVPGPNVNMVRGTKEYVGDPYLQRQNEPSIAVSTRNPCTLFAGMNDYKTVDIADPVPLPGENTAVAEPPKKDAWLGWIKSFDCGATWRTGLIFGYPQDTSVEGAQSGLKSFGAGADPIVRAGTNGMFFFGGMVFNRDATGGSKIFVTRWIDDNNSERGDDIRYLGTSTIDVGGSGQFLDKPWMAVDIPRNGFGPKAEPWLVSDTFAHENAGAAELPKGVSYCEIAAAPGIPAQRFPAGNAYVAWARFTGASDTSVPAKLMIARSNDCGNTWRTHPISNNQQTSQGATIAIAPRDGTVYVAWREFDRKQGVHAIWLTRSTDGGDTWEKPRTVASGISPFDQAKNATTFRTNALPTIAADHLGRVYVAWAERGFATKNMDKVTGDARIVLAVSTNGGASFTQRYAVADRLLGGAHQVMPALTFAAGKLQLIFYDFWDDKARIATKYVDDALAPLVVPGDATQGRRRHTVDVAAAQAEPGDHPDFKNFSVTPDGTSPKISSYKKKVDQVTGKLLDEEQINPPNLPLYNLGTTPFIGDYIDVSGLTAVPVRQNGIDVWQPNLGSINFSGGSVSTAAASASFPLLPVYHAAWTDHRDVKAPPPGLGWADYVAPGLGGAVCNPSVAGMRNANVYTSRMTNGLYVGSPGNSKPLGFATTTGGVTQHVQRAFVVFLQNTTLQEKKFLVKIATQPGAAFGDRASFLQHPRPPYAAGTPLTPPQVWRVVTVPPISTVARSVYVTAAERNAQVLITVGEVDPATIAGTLLAPVLEGLSGEPEPSLLAGGLRTSVQLNPDSTNPPTLDPDFDGPVPQILSAEEHDAVIFAPKVTTIGAVRSTQLEILNPSAPDEGNKAEETPDEGNPDEGNPDEGNPDEGNPDEGNAALLNTTIGDTVANTSITDVQWKVSNRGNTTSAYKFRPTFKRDLSKNQRFQLFVTTRYYTPTIDPAKCLVVVRRNQVVVNVANYNPRNPDEGNPDEGNPDEGNPDEGNPDEGNATFMLAPKMTATVTLRIFAEGDTPPPAEEVKRIEENTPAVLSPVSIDTGEQFIQPAFTGPELTVLEATTPATPRLSSASAAPAGVVTVFWTLKNNGTSATTVKPIANRFYLSKDRTLTGAIELVPTAAPGTSGTSFDAFLEADALATPAIEGEMPLVHQLTIPRNVAPGAYFVIIYADADRQQVEADDNNNTAALAITVAFNLTFVSQPSQATEDFTITPAVSVAVLDGAGAGVPAGDVSQVTVTLSGGAATLGGTLTRPNDGGLVTFNDLHVDNPGSSYRLNASALGSLPATSALLTIKADAAPVAKNDAYETAEGKSISTTSVNEGSPAGVLENDVDEIKDGPGTPPAGRVLTSQLVSGPQHAAVFVLHPDGNFEYTPSANYNGPDSFTYRAHDGVASSNIATVTIAVASVNDPPTAVEDSATTAEDTALVFPAADLAANDSAGANEGSQTLTVLSVGNAVNGVVELNDGVITFTPASDFNGIASFSYTVWDDGTTNGAPDHRSDTGVVRVPVTEVNDTPVAVDDSKTVATDGVLSFDAADLTGNDSPGPENEAAQTLTVTAVSATASTHGTVSLSGGTVTYTPSAGYFGAASFEYTVSDNGTTNGVSDSLTAVGLVNVTVSRGVGYYDLSLDRGNPNQVSSINIAGLQPADVGSLYTADLSQFSVLFVQNDSNIGYAAAFINNLAKVHQFVANGGVLIFHDRHVTGAAKVLPGSPGTIERNSTEDTQVNIVDGTTLVTNGPGGVLDNASLDGGTSSNHGWIVASTIPAGAKGILSTNTPNHLVLYTYPYGTGKVVYSTIPLDYYLSGSGPAAVNTNMRKYGANVVAYGNQLRQQQ